jgi:hypothetical protein
MNSINPVSIALKRLDSETHPFGQLTADESPHTVGLPARLRHKFVKRRARGSFEQGNHPLRFRAIAPAGTNRFGWLFTPAFLAWRS